MKFKDYSAEDDGRFERVFRDRGKKARAALLHGGYIEEGIEPNAGTAIDLLVDLLHFFAEEEEQQIPWLVQAAQIAVRRYQRERVSA